MRAAKILSSIISVVIKLVGRPPFDQLEVTLESSRIVPLPRTLVETTPTPCNQIKIMSFIQTGLAHSESGSQKTTTRYVYNMSIFLVSRLLNIWQRASCPRCLQTKVRGLTPPRSSKPPLPDSADVIVPEIEVRQDCALPQHSCKTFCPSLADPIVMEIEVHQLPALPQDSCKPLCPGCSEAIIASEVKVHQRWALLQQSCKPLCIWSFHFTLRKLQCGDETGLSKQRVAA